MSPPRLFTALLRSVLPPGGPRESVLGDLEELWRIRRRDHGRLQADLWYMGQALGSTVHLLPVLLRECASMNVFVESIGHSVRRLVREPRLTLISVLTLGLGIGSATAIYSVVDGVLVRPLPFRQPEELVGVWLTAPGMGLDVVNQAPALHYTFEAENRTFQDLGLWDDLRVSVTGLAEPEEVPAVRLTWRTLPLLGVSPAMGRSFLEREDRAGGPPAVLLSHGYWQRKFGGVPTVLGRSLTVDGVTREIVGVLPRSFRFFRSTPDLFVPFALDQGALRVEAFSYQAIGRLRPGVTAEQAKDDLDRLIPLALERYPGPFSLAMARQAGMATEVHSLKDDVVGRTQARTIKEGIPVDVSRMLWIVLGTVGMVLLIACANVAALMLVKGERRIQEYAVRASLGATRGRLVGNALADSTLLGVLGGGLGTLLAFGCIRLIVRLGPGTIPRLQEIGLDARVLGAALAASVLSGLAVGILPALRIRGWHTVSWLKEGGRGGGGGRSGNLARSILVVGQIALALVLLTASGLMVRSFVALRAVNPGFSRPDEVLTFRVSIPTAEEPDDARAAQTYQEILEKIRAVPAVESAALTSSLTMDQFDRNVPLEVDGFDVPDNEIPPVRRMKYVGGEYPETMGNPVRWGRSINRADVDDRRAVAVVTENLAREYWQDPAQAVGARIRPFGTENRSRPWREIVGVVGNIRDSGVGQGPVATVYFPRVVEDLFGAGVATPRSMAFAVRVGGGVSPYTVLPPMREAVWSTDRDLPLAQVRTLEDLSAGSIARTTFTLVMLGLAGGISLFLGLVGVYGVVSYVTVLRTREIGLRVAMGARSTDILYLVLGQAGKLTGIGVGTGMVLAALSTRPMASLLYAVPSWDPATFLAVATLLAVIVMTASWIPARKASRVDPVRAIGSATAGSR